MRTNCNCLREVLQDPMAELYARLDRFPAHEYPSTYISQEAGVSGALIRQLRGRRKRRDNTKIMYVGAWSKLMAWLVEQDPRPVRSP